MAAVTVVFWKRHLDASSSPVITFHHNLVQLQLAHFLESFDRVYQFGHLTGTKDAQWYHVVTVTNSQVSRAVVR